MALGSNVKNKSPEIEEISESVEESPKEELVDQEVSSEESEDQVELSFSQYCVFHAGNEEYAIPIDIVKEVVKYAVPSPIPQMPPYIIGMSNVRGNIYGVMDLEMFFQGETRVTEHKYLLVLDHDTYKMAIRIQDVPNSLMVSDDMIEQLNNANFKSVIGQKYLKGLIKKDKRMIILFDILSMISGDKFTELAG